MNTSLLKIIGAVALFGAVAITNLHAQSVSYEWAFTGNPGRGGSGYSGSGTFTVDTSIILTDSFDGFQGYAITSITGTFKGEAIIGVVSAMGFNSNNNLFGSGSQPDPFGNGYSNDDWFDGGGMDSHNGLAFRTASEQFVFIGSSSSKSVNTVIAGSASGNDFGNLAITVVTVPEPSTLALAALAGGVGLVWRRRRA